MIASPPLLQGCHILITRPPEHAEAWVRHFQALGAQTHVCPLIRIVAEPDPKVLEQALTQLPDFDYLVATSANAVALLLKALRHKGWNPAQVLKHLQLATVGPQTADALAAETDQDVHFPERHEAEYLADMLIKRGIAGKSLLYLRAEGAREVLAPALRAAGANVTEVILYHTLPPTPESLWPLLEWLKSDQLDVLTFASTSAVTHFAQAVPPSLWETASQRLLIAALGPVTAQAVQDKLGKSAIVPPTASLESLAAAISEAIARERSCSPVP